MSLAIIGAVTGYLTGIVASTGPMTVPIFMSYGLVKGALLGTEAAGSLAIYISKAITFRRFDAMPLDIVLKGLIAGSSLFAGAFIAKRFVLRLDPEYIPSADGWPDAGRGPVDALECVSRLRF